MVSYTNLNYFGFCKYTQVEHKHSMERSINVFNQVFFISLAILKKSYLNEGLVKVENKKPE